MNEKGLTLVEVIAVLIVLSIVATIVTPNIAVEIRDYKNRILETQINTIKEATKNWVADNVDKVSCNGNSALLVSIQELKQGAYLEDELKHPNKSNFDNAFGLIYCKEIIDETGNVDNNYKYEYGAYEDVDDYIKKMAVKYAKDKGSITDVTVTTNQLKTEGYIYNSIQKNAGGTLTIPSKTISVKVSDDADDYVYEATIQ